MRMRELTQEEIGIMSAEQITEFCRVQAKEEVRQKRLEKANAAKFEAIALPYVREGRDFDSFMAAEQCPSSFRSAYEKLAAEFQKAQVKSPEQVEREKLESEVQAAMGLSDPQQQAEPTGYQGADFFRRLRGLNR